MNTPKVQYAYSEMASGANHSRMTGITYPNGRVVNYNYTGFDNTISRLSELKFGPTTNEKETYTYLGLGTVVVRAHPEPNVNLSYLITGTPDGGDQYVGLDRFGRVAEQRWDRMGTATDRFQYTYDRDDNRLTKSNLLHAPNNETYSYDLLNQLTNFTRSTHTQSWSLDALGNWSTFTNDGTPQSRTHNRQNQVTQVGTTNLTFDNNGNTLTTDNGRTLTYDAWNRLMSAANGGSTVTFTYDALNRRLTETTGGTTTHLYYSAAWQVLEERLDSATAAKAQYVWSPVYIDALVLRDRDVLGDPALEERSYVQQDANYNVTALVDASGNVVLRMAYDPFGGFTLLTPTWGTPGSTQYSWVYLHQGGRYESVSALYHFRNRDESPTIGRWMQRDPIEYEAGVSNLYQYVANNPIGFVDPYGLAKSLLAFRMITSSIETMTTARKFYFNTSIQEIVRLETGKNDAANILIRPDVVILAVGSYFGWSKASGPIGCKGWVYEIKQVGETSQAKAEAQLNEYIDTLNKHGFDVQAGDGSHPGTSGESIHITGRGTLRWSHKKNGVIWYKWEDEDKLPSPYLPPGLPSTPGGKDSEIEESKVPVRPRQPMLPFDDPILNRLPDLIFALPPRGPGKPIPSLPTKIPTSVPLQPVPTQAPQIPIVPSSPIFFRIPLIPIMPFPDWWLPPEPGKPSMA